jgi:hypothetical protein
LYIKPVANDYTLKLFNLTNDPGERKNLAAEYPEKVKELESAYKEWCDKNMDNY